MTSLHRTLLWFTLTVLAICSPLHCHAQAQAQAKAVPTPEDKATDKAQMLQIWQALTAYKKANGKLPDYLSDLIPEYLPNKEVLISPAEKRTGRKGNYGLVDPKLPCSYAYEFNAGKFFNENRTFRDAKEVQMEEFGPVVPILRCFSYGNQVLSVAYSGDFFESQLMWETAPETAELMKKLGIGPGLKNGAFSNLKVVDENGKPVGDAEVQLTARNDNGYPLPDRTLKTDATGMVRVPLASREGALHRLAVKISKPGYFGMSENWNQNGYAKERQIVASSTAGIGGIVKVKDGAPLSEAEISVKLVTEKPETTKRSEQPLASIKTDAEGRWKYDAAPKNFGTLEFTVNHPTVKTTQFKSTTEAGPVSREALLAGTSEFAIAPSPIISGNVLGSDGNPIKDAEIFIRPLVLKSLANADGEKGVEYWSEALRPPSPPLKTDSQGAFSLAWSSDEKVVLTVFANSHAPTQQIVSASTNASPLKISLKKGRIASGQLTDYEGKPVSGAGVYLFMLGQNAIPDRKRVAITDSEGRFSWDSAPSHAVTLLFVQDGYAGTLKDIGANASTATQVKIGKERKK